MKQWLVLLGSNQKNDQIVRRAMQCLAGEGNIKASTPIIRFPDAKGGSTPYFNTLLMYQLTVSREALRTRFKLLEQHLGRNKAAVHEVSIDIDIIGYINDHQVWQADARALAKGDLAQPFVVTLLEELGFKSSDLVKAATQI